MKWFLFHMNYYECDIEINSDLLEKKIKGQFGNIELISQELNLSNSKIIVSCEETNDSSLKYSIYTTNNITVMGDIRIDNLEELSEKYTKNIFDNKDNYTKTIAELYSENGTKFFYDLVGDFSFVIYDQNLNVTYVVRDQLGIKPIFWCKRDEIISIASDIFLLNDFFDPTNLNKQYFRTYFNSNGNIDLEMTPYQYVKRIPSAHYLVMKNENSDLFRYWDLSMIKKKINHHNENEYIEEFTELLNKAIECRLSKEKLNAVLMSGGLDSPSIYAVGKHISNNNSKIKIKPVSAVFDELLNCDERYYINKILDLYHDEGIFKTCDSYGMLDKFPEDSPWCDEPNVNMLTFGFTQAVIEQAAIEGCRNILTGFAADHVLTGTIGITADMLRKLKFKSAFSYNKEYAASTGTSMVKSVLYNSFLPHFGKGLINETKDETKRNFIKNVSKIKNVNQKDFYLQLKCTKAHLYTDRVICPIFGVDANYPFLDRRLIEYLYSIPGELRMGKQYTKYILRKSMKYKLPKEVIKRINKTVHLQLTYKGLVKNWTNIYKVLSEARVSKLGLIEKNIWINDLNELRNGIEPKNHIFILMAIEIWLYKHECRWGSSNL